MDGLAALTKALKETEKAAATEVEIAASWLTVMNPVHPTNKRDSTGIVVIGKNFGQYDFTSATMADFECTFTLSTDDEKTHVTQGQTKRTTFSDVSARVLRALAQVHTSHEHSRARISFPALHAQLTLDLPVACGLSWIFFKNQIVFNAHVLFKCLTFFCYAISMRCPTMYINTYFCTNHCIVIITILQPSLSIQADADYQVICPSPVSIVKKSVFQLSRMAWWHRRRQDSV